MVGVGVGVVDVDSNKILSSFSCNKLSPFSCNKLSSKSPVDTLVAVGVGVVVLVGVTEGDRKSTRLNSSHWYRPSLSRMPSSA